MNSAESTTVERLISSLDPIGGMVLDPYTMLDIPAITVDDLRLGFLLGLLDDSSVSGIEAMRRRLGYPQSELQRSLAEEPAGHDWAGELLLPESLDKRALLDTPAMRRWLMVVLRLLLVRWSAGIGDPQFEAADLLDAWGVEGQHVWVKIRPRGLDALVFGTGARRRMLRRLRDFLEAPSTS